MQINNAEGSLFDRNRAMEDVSAALAHPIEALILHVVGLTYAGRELVDVDDRRAPDRARDVVERGVAINTSARSDRRSS